MEATRFDSEPWAYRKKFPSVVKIPAKIEIDPIPAAT